MLTTTRPHRVPQSWDIARYFDDRLQPLLMLIDIQTVYTVGLAALGYPPTWIDTDEEAATVEAAVLDFLRIKHNVRL